MTPSSTPFSTLIRTASHEQHVEAETSTFMSDLLGGRLGVDAYARYTEQLWFVYEALESGARELTDDPVAGPFIQPELMRLASLERDLAHLRGPGWRDGATALPATVEYAERVAECARTWPGGTWRITTRAISVISPVGRSSVGRRRRRGGSHARGTACGSMCSRTSGTLRRSSGDTGNCWMRFPRTIWRSSGLSRSAGGRSR